MNFKTTMLTAAGFLLGLAVPASANWTGKASYYFDPKGKLGAPGLTAAHRTLPFGTHLRVTNLTNRRSVVVRVNDRGPFIGGRIVDLSVLAANAIGMRHAGVVPVNVQVVSR